MRKILFLSPIFWMLILFGALPASAQQPSGPPPQIAYGPPINLEQAKRVMTAAESEATKNKWGQVIAVLDSGGHMLMLHRLDGAQLGSIEGAREKAYSAVLFRRPTKSFQDSLATNLRILRLTGSSPIEGGIPIVIDGKLVGAVGVSGGLSEQDAQVAKAGIDALK
jgi:glc operon protein GlcG